MIFSNMGMRFKPRPSKWLTILICLAISIAGHTSINAYGQKDEALTAAKVFAQLPLPATEMLRQSTRLDMIDYWLQADSLLTVANALGGESRIETAAPDYMKVAVTPVSTLEIKILQAGNRPVVMTLYTTGDQETARDTEVLFFDGDLKPLDASKFLMMPKLVDFFSLKGSGLSGADLREKIPYEAIEYTTGPGDEPLKATLTTLRVIAEEDSDLLTAILNPTLTAFWKGKYKF